MEIRARFLPSRIYSRWKWTVRGGLLLVPFLSFLAGGLLLYLSPTRYRSTALVEFENSPPAPELAKVMESRANLNHVSEQLDLVNRLNIDQENVLELLREMTEVTVIPETRLIVHSDPVISQKPHSPQVGREFSKLIGRSLLSGLLTALLLPYLMELAFPPRTTPLSCQPPAFDSET